MYQPNTKKTQQQAKLLEKIDYTQLILIELFKLGDAEQNTEDPTQFIARVNTLRRDLIPVMDNEFKTKEQQIKNRYNQEKQKIPQRNAYGHTNANREQIEQQIKYHESKETADALAELISRKGFIQLTAVGFDPEADIIDPENPPEW